MFHRAWSLCGGAPSGGLKVDQVTSVRKLERENQRLRKAVSELMQDKRILRKAVDKELKARSRAAS